MQAVRGVRSSIGAIRRVPSQARKQISGIRPPRTWEGWAILALLVAALVTRLWDLGGRALHYDEILHAWYSWLYAEGGGYAHNPLTHGPLLYHVGAATYKTIGSSEFAARLAPALFGAVLVVMPWLFRKELGRYGALTASLFLLASPTVLYFARFMRNDIYMAVWAVALLAVALRYIERPRPWLLFAWAVLWALTFASKESAFFLVGMFGLLLLARSAPALVRWVRNLRPLSQAGPAADLLIVMGTLTLPMWAPIFGLVQDMFGIILVNPDGNHPLVQSGELFRADEPTGAPVGGAKYIAGFIVLSLAAISVTIGYDMEQAAMAAAVRNVRRGLAAAVHQPLLELAGLLHRHLGLAGLLDSPTGRRAREPAVVLLHDRPLGVRVRHSRPHAHRQRLPAGAAPEHVRYLDSGMGVALLRRLLVRGRAHALAADGDRRPLRVRRGPGSRDAGRTRRDVRPYQNHCRHRVRRQHRTGRSRAVPGDTPDTRRRTHPAGRAARRTGRRHRRSRAHLRIPARARTNRSAISTRSRRSRGNDRAAIRAFGKPRRTATGRPRRANAQARHVLPASVDRDTPRSHAVHSTRLTRDRIAFQGNLATTGAPRLRLPRHRVTHDGVHLGQGKLLL